MTYLRQIALQESFGAEIVADTQGEMFNDILHGVARLLSRDPQILLQGARERREDRLGGFLWVHWNGGT